MRWSSTVIPRGLGQLSRYSGRQWARWPGFDSQQRQEIFLLSITSRQSLGPAQPPMQWIQRAVSPGLSGWGVMLTTHHHINVEVKNGGAIPTTPLRLHSVVLN
jgi:hypothetical protein